MTDYFDDESIDDDAIAAFLSNGNPPDQNVSYQAPAHVSNLPAASTNKIETVYISSSDELDNALLDPYLLIENDSCNHRNVSNQASAHRSHQPATAQLETENVFISDDEIDYDALAAAVEDGPLDRRNGFYHERAYASYQHMAPRGTISNYHHNDWDDRSPSAIPVDSRRFQKASRSAISVPAPNRLPPAQTKIGDYFHGSPVDPETIRSAIVEFNLEEAKTWLTTDVDVVTTLMYPINFPKRGYQVDCVTSAVQQNTLAVLPTGLGKTFIASVLIINMLRWYPTGKCVFMAPTCQLVLQQARACSEMVPIPTGAMTVMQDVAPDNRVSLWEQHRLIFCTPHIVQNDIRENRCPLDEIVCFVFDEAHHAKGKAPMADIVGKRHQINNRFRVLALSATPGCDRSQIQTVIDNLMIKKVLAYDRKHSEIAKYVNEREEEVIEILFCDEIRNLLKLVDELCKKPATILENRGLLTPNFTMLPLGYFRGKQFESKLKERNLENNWAIKNPAFVLNDLLAARQCLCNSSISAFVTQLQHDFTVKKHQVHISKEAAFNTAIELAKLNYLSKSVLHPKLHRLSELITSYFQQSAQSRAIVFVECKIIVDEVVSCISRCPGTLPIRFVGQQKSKGAGDSAGMSPKEQNEALKKFRSGLANVLVATCIGEEGLDIGEVDLVIEYNPTTSALRTIQRRGRTARQRRGRCVSLLMEGDEMRSYQSKLKNIEALFRLLRSPSIKLSNSPCPVRPPRIPLHIEDQNCSDIIPWDPVRLSRKQSGSSKSKVDCGHLSSQAQREFEQLWMLNETEVKSIPEWSPSTSADHVQQPVRQLVNCSEISKILIVTMGLITKARLGYIDVELGVLSPLHSEIVTSPKHSPIREVNPQKSWFSPERPSSDSDAELNDLLDDIDLLSQPSNSHRVRALVRSPSSHSPVHGSSVALPAVRNSSHDTVNVIKNDKLQFTSFKEFHETVAVIEDNTCQETVNPDITPSKRAQVRQPAKRSRKKSKFGSSVNNPEKSFFKEASTGASYIPSNVEQFYRQTMANLVDRRAYVYAHLCKRYSSQQPELEPSAIIRFPSPGSFSGLNSADLVLPLTKSG